MKVDAETKIDRAVLRGACLAARFGAAVVLWFQPDPGGAEGRSGLAR